MKERFQGLMLAAQNRWNQLDKKQRLRFIVATVVLSITLIFSIYYVMRPSMVAVLKNEDAKLVGDAQQVLEEGGIATTVEDNASTLLVKEKDFQNATIVLSSSPVMEGTDFKFEDAAELITVGTTESVKDEALNQAKGDEIAASLKAFDGVVSAKVIPAIPKTTNYFLTDETPTTASVFLETNKEIDSEAAKAIAKYVSSSIVGLEMENVTIVDQNKNTLYDGQVDSGINLTQTLKMEDAKETEAREAIVAQLEPMYDDIKVSANIVLNNDNTVIEDQTYSPVDVDNNTGIVTKDVRKKQSVEGTTVNGEPGVNSNDETADTYVLDTDSASSSKSDESATDYAVNSKKTTTTVSPGTVDQDKSSYAVALYDYQYFYETEAKKAGELDDMTWEDFKETKKAELMDVPPETVQNINSALGSQNVVVTGYTTPIFVDKVSTPLNVKDYTMFAVLALLFALLAFLIIKNTGVEEIEEIEPPLDIEDMLVTSQMEEELKREKKDELKIKRQSETRAQIDKFVDDQPETVANLLRTWLNEEWE